MHPHTRKPCFCFSTTFLNTKRATAPPPYCTEVKVIIVYGADRIGRVILDS